MALLNPSVYVKAKGTRKKTRPVWKTAKMLKKITTEIRAALILIVAENLAALRNFFKSITNSVCKSFGKHQDAIWQSKKRP